VIALARNGKVLNTFEGVVEGNIVDLPRGRNGFGYDPVFQPNGFEQTFAEMAPELKNKISHRAKAIAALREALLKIGN
jgi:XTP/dITP diphosphohydrolase